MSKKELFAIFDGTPAHIMIVIGLALSLLGPMMPRYQAASAAAERAQYEQAVAFADLDLEAFKKVQSKEKAAQDKQDEAKPLDPANPDALTQRTAERQKRADARDLALKAKTDELDAKYDQMGKKRAWLESQGNAAGARSYLLILWIGRALLLLGLMAMTFQSEGTRQKIYLVVLLVVLFSSLAGVNLDLSAQGHVGESSSDTHVPK